MLDVSKSPVKGMIFAISPSVVQRTDASEGAINRSAWQVP
jgi:hypothetical protein